MKPPCAIGTAGHTEMTACLRAPGAQCTKECVLNKDNGNAGSQCPWKGAEYGLKCDCGDVNCWGQMACARGSCPSDSVGVLCRRSGSSRNYKLCS